MGPQHQHVMQALAIPPLRPGRAVTGMSAVLLPWREASGGDPGGPDWPAFEAHVARTHAAGLTPAVNMDTGYVQLLGPADVEQALGIAAAVTGGRFVAGAFVGDRAGDPFDLARYVTAASAIATHGGTPVVFPSHGLNGLDDIGWVAAHATLGAELDRFIGFELGAMFVPYGRIPGLDAYRGLLDVPACIGAKHSSLDRRREWERLAVRDATRPDFLLLTGNDLAIDMVTYGSDYLLGLSTFAPDLFAERDRRWQAGDPTFHELNDLLQYLGHFTFRPPVPAYRHAAATFLQLRGWTTSDAAPPGTPRRPDADRAVLADIADRLGVLA